MRLCFANSEAHSHKLSIANGCHNLRCEPPRTQGSELKMSGAVLWMGGRQSDSENNPLTEVDQSAIRDRLRKFRNSPSSLDPSTQQRSITLSKHLQKADHLRGAMSASRRCRERSAVWEWHTVTVASRDKSICATGIPTKLDLTHATVSSCS